MATRAKIGGLCCALLVAASATALGAGLASAQQSSGNDLSDLSTQILNNPTDAALNIRYAEAAEAAGKPRLALAAYERILINDPDNQDARRGYERLRREIEPGYTVTRLELGARWDSNPLDVGFNEEEATTYYAQLMIANEHTFFGRRWRTLFNATVEENPDIESLDYDYLGVQTGPIFYAAPHLAVIPAIGGNVSWLGGDRYFSEGNLSVTVEGRTAGASYWARARAGYRDYNPDLDSFFSTVTESGSYVELVAGFAKPHLLFERDTFLVSPFVRSSDVDGDVFDFWIFDELSPGKYLEYGVDVNYNYELTDHLQASVGALVRERDFTDSERSDTYVSPQASLTLRRALPCNCDLTLRYRHRQNDSNELFSDYEANQVALQLTTRF